VKANPVQSNVQQHIKHNFITNVVDGGFFGWGLGFASFVTVIPLFMSQLTDSAVLIGLVVALHNFGWQLPQVFVSGWVTRLNRYKPMVMRITLHERWPFFALAGVALLSSVINTQWAAILAVLVIAIHAFSAGLAAPAWQSMIAKVIPQDRIGTFFGSQSGAANTMSAIGAIVAGLILVSLPAPYNFALSFSLTGLLMMISMWFLGRTREPEHEVRPESVTAAFAWKPLLRILQRDTNFRWYLIVRSLSNFVWMAINFYTVYAVGRFGLDTQTVGFLPALFLISQGVAAPVLGWLGDRIGHRLVYAGGVLVMVISALLAMTAQQLPLFFVAYILAGASNAAYWSVGIALSLEFARPEEKPLYVGLINTGMAPFLLISSLIGGALADNFGYPAAFGFAAIMGLITIGVTLFLVRDPKPLPNPITQTQPLPAVGD
jgi:MFS family permease